MHFAVQEKTVKKNKIKIGQTAAKAHLRPTQCTSNDNLWGGTCKCNLNTLRDQLPFDMVWSVTTFSEDRWSVRRTRWLEKRWYLAEEHAAVWLFLEGQRSSKRSFSCKFSNPSNSLRSHSNHRGEFVYEIVDSVDHQLDVVLLGHAVLAVSPQDDVHVGAEDALRHLHGDVPWHVFILEPVDESHGTSDGDWTVEHAVVFSLAQKVHVEFVVTLLWVFGRYSPLSLLLKFFTRLKNQTKGKALMWKHQRQANGRRMK